MGRVLLTDWEGPIATALVRALLADPGPFRSRAAEGATALRAYTWDRFAAGTAAVYREVADGSSRV